MEDYAARLNAFGAERRGVRGGDIVKSTEAFAQEALAELDALYNYGRHLAGNETDAEELLQETYARAFAGAHSFVGGSIKAWLFKILRNTFIDGYRRRGRARELGGGDGDVANGGNGQGEGSRQPLRGDGHLELLRGLVTADIVGALAALSEDGRAIILLDVEGFTEVEVADIMGCAVGTVKSRLSRARALLREHLKDYAR